MECEERPSKRVPQPTLSGILEFLFLGGGGPKVYLKFSITPLFHTFLVLPFKCLCCHFNQVCHIVLGLRPATPQEEGQIIR